jgi:hypothetical protein
MAFPELAGSVGLQGSAFFDCSHRRTSAGWRWSSNHPLNFSALIVAIEEKALGPDHPCSPPTNSADPPMRRPTKGWGRAGCLHRRTGGLAKGNAGYFPQSTARTAIDGLCLDKAVWPAQSWAMTS